MLKQDTKLCSLREMSFVVGQFVDGGRKAFTPDKKGVWHLKGQILFGVRKFHPYVKVFN